MNDSPAAAGPIFITGLDHSGKTRLRLLLGRSPSLSLTRRTELWTTGHEAHGALIDDDALSACLASLLVRRAVAEMVGDPSELRAAFRSGPATHARLYSLIHALHAARSGADRWGDQDSQVERFAHRILADLPDARIVHLVIDPRRRYASLVRAGLTRPGAVGAATAAWVSSARRGADNMAMHPDRYRVLNAEATDDPGALDSLLRFLEVAGIDTADGGRPPASTEPAQIHRHELDFIEATARDEMRGRGYPIDERKMSAAERFRGMALHRPIGWARYRVRMIRERAAEERSRKGREAL